MTKLLCACMLGICLYACNNEKTEIKPTVTPFDPRDSFLGEFTITDTNKTANKTGYVLNTYKLTISKDSAVRDTIYFNNICNSGKRIFAVLKKRKLTIPSQKYINPYYISGGGHFNTPADVAFIVEAYPYTWKAKGSRQ